MTFPRAYSESPYRRNELLDSSVSERPSTRLEKFVEPLRRSRLQFIDPVSLHPPSSQSVILRSFESTENLSVPWVPNDHLGTLIKVTPLTPRSFSLLGLSCLRKVEFLDEHPVRPTECGR